MNQVPSVNCCKTFGKLHQVNLLLIPKVKGKTIQRRDRTEVQVLHRRENHQKGTKEEKEIRLTQKIHQEPNPPHMIPRHKKARAVTARKTKAGIMIKAKANNNDGDRHPP